MVVSDKNNEINSWQHKAAHLEEHYHHVLKDTSALQTSETRADLLSKENHKLNMSLKGLVEENERLLGQCSELRVSCEGHRRKVSMCQEENILLMADVEKARLYSLTLEEKKSVEKELDMYKNRSDYLE